MIAMNFQGKIAYFNRRAEKPDEFFDELLQKHGPRLRELGAYRFEAGPKRDRATAAQLRILARHFFGGAIDSTIEYRHLLKPLEEGREIRLRAYLRNGGTRQNADSLVRALHELVQKTSGVMREKQPVGAPIPNIIHGLGNAFEAIVGNTTEFLEVGVKRRT